MTDSPTAAELLQTPFFRAAKKKSYLVGAILSESFNHVILAYHPHLAPEELPPLTQRQERRVVNRISSVNSVESWDFTTTVTTIRRSGDIFTGDDQGDLNISPLTRESGPDVSPCEQENSPSSSSSKSGCSSLLQNSSTTPSSSSSLLHTSPPSSYMESSTRVQENESNSELLVSTTKNTNQDTLTSSETSLPSPPTPRRMPSSNSTPTVSTNQQGLWRKIKNNVRPSSRGDGEGLDNGPRKERGRIGNIFASSSRGLSSKLSSRSLANGMLSLLFSTER